MTLEWDAAQHHHYGRPGQELRVNAGIRPRQAGPAKTKNRIFHINRPVVVGLLSCKALLRVLESSLVGYAIPADAVERPPGLPNAVILVSLIVSLRTCSR